MRQTIHGTQPDRKHESFQVHKPSPLRNPLPPHARSIIQEAVEFKERSDHQRQQERHRHDPQRQTDFFLRYHVHSPIDS